MIDRIKAIQVIVEGHVGKASAKTIRVQELSCLETLKVDGEAPPSILKPSLLSVHSLSSAYFIVADCYKHMHLTTSFYSICKNENISSTVHIQDFCHIQ